MQAPTADPLELPLAAWLNAGYVMLIEQTDPEARQLLDELFAAETLEDMEDAHADLEALAGWRNKKAKEAEKALGHDDKPTFGKKVPRTELQEAFEEWTAIAAASQAATPAADE